MSFVFQIDLFLNVSVIQIERDVTEGDDAYSNFGIDLGQQDKTWLCETQKFLDLIPDDIFKRRADVIPASRGSGGRVRAPC